MKKSLGVTLVELSIVLAILGILVVASVTGVTMVNNARSLSVIKIIQDRNTQLTTFKNLYNCIAGDCADASVKIKGIYVDVTYGNANGNGNKLISVVESVGVLPENLFLEHHLIQSDLSNRTLSGTSLYDMFVVQRVGYNVATHNVNPLRNILPKLPIKEGFLSSFTNGNQRVVHVIGGVNLNAMVNTRELSDFTILSIIDIKIDDGTANTGNIMCGNRSNGDYNISYRSVGYYTDTLYKKFGFVEDSNPISTYNQSCFMLIQSDV